MGSTFAAVHVKGATVAQLSKRVRRSLKEVGFAAIADDEPEWELERRVLVLAGRGWGVVADEDQEHDHGAGEELARELSEELETAAVAISVFHGNVAMLTAYREGQRLGGFQIPDDAQLDRATGHKSVSTKFLASLARSKEARESLEAGVFRFFPLLENGQVLSLIGLGAH